jgi:hypothetical protein
MAMRAAVSEGDRLGSDEGGGVLRTLWERKGEGRQEAAARVSWRRRGQATGGGRRRGGARASVRERDGLG